MTDAAAFDELTRVIATLEAMAGPSPMLRLCYAPTWGESVFVTVTLTPATPPGRVRVVFTGDEYRSMCMEVLRGGPVRHCPSVRDVVGPLDPGAEQTLRSLMDASIFELRGGEVRGTDGHMLTIEVFDPQRGRHRASDWSPGRERPVGAAAAAILEGAVPVAPALREADWVVALLGEAPASGS